MTNSRLGKRERQLLKLAKSQGKRQKPVSFAGDMTQPWMRSPNGSVSGVSSLMGSTHANFRGKGAAYGVKTIYHSGVVKWHVPPKTGWVAQAPLPTDHALLLSLERGHKVAPVAPSELPRKPVYPTAPTERRFGKTK